ncbi:MAG: sortase [Holdemanella porci]
MVYEVVDSIVVEPEAIFMDIGIEKNRDLLSLVTCTPYGINTKRLVVRAKRVFPKKKEKKVRKSYSFRELCFILIPIICVMVVKW